MNQNLHRNDELRFTLDSANSTLKKRCFLGKIKNKNVEKSKKCTVISLRKYVNKPTKIASRQLK